MASAVVRQYIKFALLVAFYLVVSLCAMAAQVWSDNRWVESTRSVLSPASAACAPSSNTTAEGDGSACIDVVIPTLPDLVHSWFPVAFGSTYARVILTDAIIYSVGAITWLLGAVATPNDRSQVARRTLFLISCLFLLRCLTISVTGLPPSSRDCQPLSYRDDPREFFRVLLLNGPSGACTDLMFSGHTAITTIMAAWWWFESRNTVYGNVGWIGATIVWALACFTFTASRLHYTADVLIGGLIAALVYTAWMLVYKRVHEQGGYRSRTRRSSAVKIGPRIPRALYRLVAWIECMEPSGEQEFLQVLSPEIKPRNDTELEMEVDLSAFSARNDSDSDDSDARTPRAISVLDTISNTS